MRADDIVQATVTALFRYWRRAAEVDNLDAYVHRMLVRNFLNERRLKWSRVLLMSETPDRPASGTVVGVILQGNGKFLPNSTNYASDIVEWHC